MVLRSCQRARPADGFWYSATIFFQAFRSAALFHWVEFMSSLIHPSSMAVRAHLRQYLIIELAILLSYDFFVRGETCLAPETTRPVPSSLKTSSSSCLPIILQTLIDHLICLFKISSRGHRFGQLAPETQPPAP